MEKRTTPTQPKPDDQVIVSFIMWQPEKARFLIQCGKCKASELAVDVPDIWAYCPKCGLETRFEMAMMMLAKQQHLQQTSGTTGKQQIPVPIPPSSDKPINS